MLRPPLDPIIMIEEGRNINGGEIPQGPQNTESNDASMPVTPVISSVETRIAQVREKLSQLSSGVTEEASVQGLMEALNPPSNF